jgi:hypothetical protein
VIDHVTVHVPRGTLDNADLSAFMLAIGLDQIEAAESVPEGWRVRWFASYTHGLLGSVRDKTVLHLVEPAPEDDAGPDQLSLGHFCVKGIGRPRLEALRRTSWCVRDSGSGRIWLHYANMRVEVRP